MSNRGFVCCFFFNIVSIILICIQGNSGEICWMVYKFSSSAKYCVSILLLNQWLGYNIFHIAGSHFSCSLVFYKGGSVFYTLYGKSCNQLSTLGPICQVGFFKEYSVTNFQISWGAVCCLLCVFKPIIIQSFLSYGKCKVL